MSHQILTTSFDAVAAHAVLDALFNCVDNGYKEDLRADSQQIIESLIEHGVIDSACRHDSRLTKTVDLWKEVFLEKEKNNV